MDWKLFAEADRVVAQLSPGKRETVREIVVDAARHGALSDRARHFVDTITGSSLVSEVLEAAIAESGVGQPLASLPSERK